MANYYIDYENVHNEGLKGVQQLTANDKLHLFYSSKADTLKIDVVRQLMDCAAEIEFDKIINGVENALDFQLITALMCKYCEDDVYYIISRDKGYDAAIEMAGKQNRANIYRCRDIEGALKHQSGLGIDESDQEVIVDLDIEAPEEAVIWSEPELVVAEEVPEAAEVAEAPAPEPEEYTEAAPVELPDTEAPEVSEVAEEAEETDAAEDAAVTEEELQRRAYQSICTKILNHIKLVNKIPITYKQAGYIYEALSESDSKMQFYHKLLQLLGRSKGSELYHSIKIAYKQILGIYKSSQAADTLPDEHDSSDSDVYTPDEYAEPVLDI